MAARNMQRIEINIHEEELCVKLVIYKDCLNDHSLCHLSPSVDLYGNRIRELFNYILYIMYI